MEYRVKGGVLHAREGRRAIWQPNRFLDREVCRQSELQGGQRRTVLRGEPSGPARADTGTRPESDGLQQAGSTGVSSFRTKRRVGGRKLRGFRRSGCTASEQQGKSKGKALSRQRADRRTATPTRINTGSRVSPSPTLLTGTMHQRAPCGSSAPDLSLVHFREESLRHAAAMRYPTKDIPSSKSYIQGCRSRRRPYLSPSALHASPNAWKKRYVPPLASIVSQANALFSRSGMSIQTTGALLLESRIVPESARTADAYDSASAWTWKCSMGSTRAARFNQGRVKRVRDAIDIELQDSTWLRSPIGLNLTRVVVRQPSSFGIWSPRLHCLDIPTYMSVDIRVAATMNDELALWDGLCASYYSAWVPD
ncbi:hypothetical protein B0H11DRAFT_2194391 [Mycena galericulata]|nr:hypothetical protein B0H11DRAFT_2194391 [Mycena galericulata]